jgi:hypothetical protein
MDSNLLVFVLNIAGFLAVLVVFYRPPKLYYKTTGFWCGFAYWIVNATGITTFPMTILIGAIIWAVISACIIEKIGPALDYWIKKQIFLQLLIVATIISIVL